MMLRENRKKKQCIFFPVRRILLVASTGTKSTIHLAKVTPKKLPYLEVYPVCPRSTTSLKARAQREQPAGKSSYTKTHHLTSPTVHPPTLVWNLCPQAAYFIRVAKDYIVAASGVERQQGSRNRRSGTLMPPASPPRSEQGNGHGADPASEDEATFERASLLREASKTALLWEALVPPLRFFLQSPP